LIISLNVSIECIKESILSEWFTLSQTFDQMNGKKGEKHALMLSINYIQCVTNFKSNELTFTRNKFIQYSTYFSFQVLSFN